MARALQEKGLVLANADVDKMDHWDLNNNDKYTDLRSSAANASKLVDDVDPTLIQSQDQYDPLETFEKTQTHINIKEQE